MRKYIYCLIITIVFLLILFNWVYIFKLYKVTSNLNVEYFKKYTIRDYKITYYLPSNFTVKTLDYNDNEILYHADFKSNDGSIWGIVEVMNINEDLLNYLKKSKESATGVVDFKFFNIYNKKISNKNGFVLEYLRKGNDNRYYRAQEYFLNINGNVFRMSFFMPNDLFNTNFLKLFETIVSKTIFS